MPAMRLTTRRRRSSHAIFTPAKPGIYGVVQPRPVTFAPNVTPITYVETDDDDLLSPISPPSPSSSTDPSSIHQQTTAATIFPPSSTPAPPPARKRCPPGKRRSQGYIPRPPNAFMLFRADFVRQKHVPGSIETNHGSLSKIIGNCWRQLPLDEKRIWEIKAKQEKANHKAQFPDYRFRPVHNKNKNKDKSSTTTSSSTAAIKSNSSSNNNPDGMTQEEEERRCEQVAQLLLGGMKGEELARAIRDLDRVREEEASSSRILATTTTTSSDTSNSFETGSLAMPIPTSPFPFGFSGFGFGMNSNSGLALPPSAYHRRSSSVPLPLPNGSDFFMSPFGDYSAPSQPLDIGGIALPSVPYISSHSQTRPSSPVNNISRQHQQRTLLGHRRASSAQPVIRRSWTLPVYPTNTTYTGNSYTNTDFSGFDWASMSMDVNTNIQVERDQSPLPDVDPEFFNGFSFNDGGAASSTSLSIHALSSSGVSSSSSSASSSASDRNSPWLDTPSHSQHLSIAPHDLPPLDILSSSDMNWPLAPSAHGQQQALLSATSTTASSTFPSPALSSVSASAACTSVPANGKEETTPTSALFDLHLGLDYGLGMDIHGMGVVDYGYGYNNNDIGTTMGFGGDMGYNILAPTAGAGAGNDMGMGTDMDTMMWNVTSSHSQAQQA